MDKNQRSKGSHFLVNKRFSIQGASQIIPHHIQVATRSHGPRRAKPPVQGELPDGIFPAICFHFCSWKRILGKNMAAGASGPTLSTPRSRSERPLPSWPSSIPTRLSSPCNECSSSRAGLPVVQRQITGFRKKPLLVIHS